MINIPLLQIYGKSTMKPSQMTIKSSIEIATFFQEKGDKRKSLKNYRIISLLVISGLIYNEIFEFLIKYDLIPSNQSEFKPGNSCLNQLLPMTHEIYQSLDADLEVRGVFLEIYKAFEKVWHDSLIYKLRDNGVTDKVLNIFNGLFEGKKTKISLK